MITQDIYVHDPKDDSFTHHLMFDYPQEEASKTLCDIDLEYMSEHPDEYGDIHWYWEHERNDCQPCHICIGMFVKEFVRDYSIGPFVLKLGG